MHIAEQSMSELKSPVKTFGTLLLRQQNILNTHIAFFQWLLEVKLLGAYRPPIPPTSVKDNVFKADAL
jgi:ABC-type phosphate transport system ATPase subunit